MVRPAKTAVQPVSSLRPRTCRAPVDFLREPSTWAGLLSIAAAIATGGASVLTDPILLAQVGTGIGLVLAREGDGRPAC